MHNPQKEFMSFMRPDAAEYYAHQLTKSTAAVIGERNGTPMVTSHLASRQAIMRDFLEKFRPWIEGVLRVGFAETIIFEFGFGMAHIAAPYLVEGLLLGRSEESPQAELQKHLESVEFPPDFVPAVGVSPYRKLGVSLKKRRAEWSGEWRDCPVALHFRGLGAPVVVVRFPFSQGPHDCHWGEIVLTPKVNAAALLNLVETATQKNKRPRLHTINVGFQGVPHSSWSDLVLDPSIVQLVKNDFESFFDREEWFRRNRLPFRRGYLLYGPPGNGKTSVIRAMLSNKKLNGCTLNLFACDTDDSDLTKLFDYAADFAPSLIVLEDIDRAFPRSGAVRTNVSLQALLNCLDGVRTHYGVIVVATANEPTVLDPAILRRPGRFDRVVEFPNPNAACREQYFRFLQEAIPPSDVQSLVAESCDLSFAQLRESYILAGQRAFEQNREIVTEDLQVALRVLRGCMSAVSDHSQKLGFNVNSGKGAVRTLLNQSEESCPF
jgi:ATPase family protein associated with various cellular activities (AAA)